MKCAWGGVSCVTKGCFWATGSVSRAVGKLVSPWLWKETTQLVSHDWKALNSIQGIGDKQVSLQLMAAPSWKGNVRVPWPQHCSRICPDDTHTSGIRWGFPLVSPMAAECGALGRVSSQCSQCLFLCLPLFQKHSLAFSVWVCEWEQCEASLTLSPSHQGTCPLTFLVQETYMGFQHDLWPSMC